jgi:nicotinate-nucleotide adenylyltransferase
MTGLGIFGGTFDPIHLGHLIIAEQTRDKLKLDKIIFVPNGNPPHKINSFTDKKFRLEMLNLAIEDNEKFEISDIEINKTGYCYTLDMIKELKQIFNKELFFIMGADSLVNIKTWYKYEELLKLCNFIIFPRIFKNDTMEQWEKNKLQDWVSKNLTSEENKFIFIDFPIIEISSTEIRRKIRENSSIKYMVPPKVITYIYENNIY